METTVSDDRSGVRVTTTTRKTTTTETATTPKTTTTVTTTARPTSACSDDSCGSVKTSATSIKSDFHAASTATKNELPNTGVSDVIGIEVTTQHMFLSPVPFFATVILSAAGCLLLLCCVFWLCVYICQRRIRRRKARRNRRFGALGAPRLGLLQEKIQPDMEELLVDTGEDDTKTFIGKINFSVDYNVSSGVLTMTVIQAQQLPAMDIGGLCDAYVKVRLLPAKHPTYTTKVQHNTCNPLFHETFTFEVSYGELGSRTLALQVYDYDRSSADYMIGQVFYPLSHADVTHVQLEWRDLKSTSDVDQTSNGDICFSLRYVPATGLLTVVVLEAKDLPVQASGEHPDSAVKLTLYDGKKKKKKVSTTRKSSINPYFNESFTFDVTLQQIQNVSLKVSVLAPWRIGHRKKVIGYVELGSNIESVVALRHWTEMLANPRRAVATWHQLSEVVKE